MRLSRNSKRIIFGAQYLSVGTVRNTAKIINQDLVDGLITRSNFLDKAPFSWIHLTFLYGNKNNLKVDFKGIDEEYKDLIASVELDVEILKWADQNSHKLLHDIFMIAALESLMQIGKKYDLPTNIFEEERTNYLTIPKDVEHCQFYCGLVG